MHSHYRSLFSLPESPIHKWIQTASRGQAQNCAALSDHRFLLHFFTRKKTDENHNEQRKSKVLKFAMDTERQAVCALISTDAHRGTPTNSPVTHPLTSRYAVSRAGRRLEDRCDELCVLRGVSTARRGERGGSDGEWFLIRTPTAL